MLQTQNPPALALTATTLDDVQLVLAVCQRVPHFHGRDAREFPGKQGAVEIKQLVGPHTVLLTQRGGELFWLGKDLLHQPASTTSLSVDNISVLC